jgi:Txe/YoeB family toxin of Txe-Axe toxin-antitoxin module
MEIIPFTKKQEQYIKRFGLKKKIDKQIKLLLTQPRNKSLNIEKLNPANAGLYSFRIDKKYRAIFVVSNGVIEIITLTNHYK